MFGFKNKIFSRKLVMILIAVLGLLVITGSTAFGASEIDVSYSVTINRSVEDVFAFTSNPDNFALYTTGVNEMKVVSGALAEETMGLGTVLVQERVFLGRTNTTEIRVSEYIPNKLVSYTVASGFGEGLVVEEAIEPSVSADGTPTTILTFSARGPLTGVSKLIAPVASQMYQRQLEVDLTALKDLLESEY